MREDGGAGSVITVMASESGRVDQILARAVPELSRTRVKDLILSGQVAVGGRTIGEAKTKVDIGDEIRVAVPPPVAAEPRGEDIALSIAYEDEALIVIDKPAGLVVHPAPGHAGGTLVNALIAHCGASLSGIGGVARPGIVHRLDKDTSGLMVVAKSDAAHRGLAAQFADHGREGALVRSYRAFVWGVPDRPYFTVDAPIDRHKHARDKMAVRADGRYAVTHVEREESFGDGLVALLACRLETGRTHQIRVHMAHVGHPLLGDPVYATGFKTKAARLSPEAAVALAALGRQALHAAELGFEHPVTGETLHFTSPLPPDLSRLRLALAAM